MDNEIYEPLNQFDPDMRDLMMDCITEKATSSWDVWKNLCSIKPIADLADLWHGFVWTYVTYVT